MPLQEAAEHGGGVYPHLFGDGGKAQALCSQGPYFIAVQDFLRAMRRQILCFASHSKSPHGIEGDRSCLTVRPVVLLAVWNH